MQNSLLILHSLYNYKKEKDILNIILLDFREIWGKAGVLAEEENILMQIWIKSTNDFLFDRKLFHK